MEGEKKEYPPMSEEQIQAEEIKNAMEPFDSESERAKVEQYSDIKKGELMSARREASELLGIDDEKIIDDKMHPSDSGKTRFQAILDDVKLFLALKGNGHKDPDGYYREEEFKNNTKKGFHESWENHEFVPVMEGLIRAEEKINRNVQAGRGVLNKREVGERKKKIADFAKKLREI